MDGHQFDDLLRAALTSRRSVLGLVLAAGGAITSRDLTAARKKKPCPPCKKRKKGKCKGRLPDGAVCTNGTCQGGTCVLTVKPACANGMIDGSETDTDCGGGTCPRCVNGKHCVRRADCASAFCSTFGACVACATHDECRATGGQCFCAAPPDGGPKNCYASAPVPGTAGCVACPPGTVCQFANTPGAGCFQLCNAL